MVSRRRARPATSQASSSRQKLLKFRADPNSDDERTEHGPRNILNRIGSTPFLPAAELTDIPYMKLLLAYGPTPQSRRLPRGATPLMAAARWPLSGFGEMPHHEEAFEAVKICTITATLGFSLMRRRHGPCLPGAAHRGANEKFLSGRRAQSSTWSPSSDGRRLRRTRSYNRIPSIGISTRRSIVAQLAPTPRRQCRVRKTWLRAMRARSYWPAKK